MSMIHAHMQKKSIIIYQSGSGALRCRIVAFAVHKFQQGFIWESICHISTLEKITHSINRSSIHSTPITTRRELRWVYNYQTSKAHCSFISSYRSHYVSLCLPDRISKINYSENTSTVKCQKGLQPEQDKAETKYSIILH